MKKMKKLTSLLLVLVMSLALAVPCFATEPDVPGEVIKEWNTNGFQVQLIKLDDDAAIIKPRGDLLSDYVYTSNASPRFTWTCCLYPTLRINIDCTGSSNGVGCVLTLAGNTFDMGDADAGERYIITAKRSDGFMSYDFVAAELSLTPRGTPMYCSVYAWEQ
nr:hypothetical protein [uncultured Oscillibacter sp.]